MCLCKGTGKITEQIGNVITFNACPDSHCTHDKRQPELKWQQFKKEMREWEARAERDSVVS